MQKKIHVRTYFKNRKMMLDVTISNNVAMFGYYATFFFISPAKQSTTPDVMFDMSHKNDSVGSN